MRIDAGNSRQYVGQTEVNNTASTRTRSPQSFSTALAAADTSTAGTADVTQPDFTSMTRQEMRDWVNDQIRSGNMTLDESTPFVGMTLKVSAQNSQLVDSATDTTRINFMEKTRLGIEGALSRNDQEEVKQLQAALDLMSKLQNKTVSIDTNA